MFKEHGRCVSHMPLDIDWVLDGSVKVFTEHSPRGFLGDDYKLCLKLIYNLIYIERLLQCLLVVLYIEDITRWREDMNFIFEWQNNILRTSEASE